MLAFDQFAALRYGALQVNLVQQGQWYRFLSAVFPQGSWAEFGINVTVLLCLGTALERLYGTITFLAIFGASATAANAGVYAYGGPTVHSGAVEALCGLCGAVGVAAFRYRDERLLTSQPVLSGLGLFAVYLFLTGMGGPAITHVLHPHGALCWQACICGLSAGVLCTIVVPAPRPKASLLWKVLLPLLLVLAAAPFGGLGRAVYISRVAAARPPYSDPKGFSVQAPQETVMVKGLDGAIFMGPSYYLHVGVMPSLHAPAGATIDSYKDELLSDLAIRHMKVKTSEIAIYGSRRWLVVRATQADNQDRQYGYTIEGAIIYLVTEWGRDLDAGAAPFRTLLETFTLSQGAFSSAAPTNKPGR